MRYPIVAAGLLGIGVIGSGLAAPAHAASSSQQLQVLIIIPERHTAPDQSGPSTATSDIPQPLPPAARRALNQPLDPPAIVSVAETRRGDRSVLLYTQVTE